MVKIWALFSIHDIYSLMGVHVLKIKLTVADKQSG